MVGMLFGFAMELYLWRWTHVPFTWWVMIGTCMTFGVGYGLSFFFGDKNGNGSSQRSLRTAAEGAEKNGTSS
jgi:hypothetical protein